MTYTRHWHKPSAACTYWNDGNTSYIRNGFTSIDIGNVIVTTYRFDPKICLICYRRIEHGKRGFRLA